MLFIALLAIDIMTSLWNKMTITLLVIILLFILSRITIRYIELRKEDADNENSSSDGLSPDQEGDVTETKETAE